MCLLKLSWPSETLSKLFINEGGRDTARRIKEFLLITRLFTFIILDI